MNGKAIGLALILMLGLLAPAMAKENPLVFKGVVGEDIPYQKSIEAVAISNGTIYAACDYRMTAGKELIGVYYLGLMAAYSTNGSRLWVNSSGYVVKIQPLDRGVLAGGLGGFVFLDGEGHIKANFPTPNKLYDFVMENGYVYGVDGDIWHTNGTFSSSGEVFRAKLLDNGSLSLEDGWRVRLPSMPGRVRLGDVVYVGSGLPSGYSAHYHFGALYGVSYDGKLLWNISTGWWVRDLEVWGGKAIAGTGFNNTKGYILMVDGNGHVMWNESTFFVEDLLVVGDTLYASGFDGRNGKVTAYDLNERKLLWSEDFPYRVKTLAYGDGKLIVGIGKFESRREGNVTKVYSEGGLYVLNPENGKVLWKDLNVGYVRSTAVQGNLVVAGTGSSYFYVLDLSKIRGSKGICGPAFMIFLSVLAGFAVRGGSHGGRAGR
ncbi:outer membrane protein assembly factor BamB family protein [Thermococcus gammatolerans]|uniref:Quinoprotein dehydrogenase, putative n=1 Tax=Thermococcus gammatolerans (strain DSM 15229 / JCM 11827 / EJ3) TaxID=593117 RepID=C5A716_THEGJ|nr:PQQ-binding-like beta-propeller repeat protein [Thermococcus gammatolerans]ACS34028.1 Quinoprotein dehydrogenase, putative [Thermococcus gammatolerans EJ3]